MPSDPEIVSFLMATADKNEHIGEIMNSLRRIVQKNYPGSTEELKYRGICFFDAGLMVGGILPRKEHVSLEFGEGAAMTDADGFLEGTGKFRRHLKIRTIDEIESKKVSYYLTQAFHD